MRNGNCQSFDVKIIDIDSDGVFGRNLQEWGGEGNVGDFIC